VRNFTQLVIRKDAIFITYAVFGGADLENDVATAFEVIGG
jgi:hypothetical protein